MNALIRRLQPLSALALALCPSLASAEGAVRLLECQVTQICDAAGACAAAAEQLSFRMKPQALDDEGRGRYVLRYGEIEAGMEALSEAGPFYWTQAQERNTLLASSESSFLWHQLSLGPAPEASISFLDCTVRM